jgi:hypothetical protein
MLTPSWAGIKNQVEPTMVSDDNVDASVGWVSEIGWEPAMVSGQVSSWNSMGIILSDTWYGWYPSHLFLVEWEPTHLENFLKVHTLIRY